MFCSAHRDRGGRLARLLGHLALGLLLMLSTVGCREEAGTASTRHSDKTSPVDPKTATAKQILQQVQTAYSQATSYADSGEFTIRADDDGEERVLRRFSFAVTYEKPNKLRLNAFGVMLTCDGKQLHAAIHGLDGQILAVEAPPEITLDAIYADPILGQALGGGIDVVLPQLKLLLDDQALGDELTGTATLKRLEDQKIGDDLCQVVEATSEAGSRVYWVDATSHALRRLEYPIGPLEKILDPSGSLKNLAVRADLKGAQLDKTVSPVAFEFEVPENGHLLSKFLSAPPTPPAPMLGQKAEGFEFVRLDGEKVTPESLRGKIVVFDFWATWCGWCFKGFPSLEKVYEQFKDDEQVVILTVNTDNPDITDEQVQAAFDKHGYKLPIVRDREMYNTNVFRVSDLPATYIVGADGTVQDVVVGFDENLVEVLPAKLKRLKAGEDLAKVELAAYQEKLKAYDKELAAATVGNSAVIEIPAAKIAPQSEPSSLQLAKLWTATELKKPGNVLVVQTADSQPTIAVLDGWRAVVELDAAGGQVARHELDIPDEAAISYLRTAIENGQRYYVGFATGQQQLHLFDAQWKRLLSFPDTRDGQHAGISDVQFGDLDDDGHIAINVGFFGVVGVKQVSLDGKLIWSNRQVENLYRVAVTAPDAQKHSFLLCANGRDRVIAIDYHGKATGEIPAPNRAVHCIVAADLAGDGASQLCGLSTTQVGQTIALGFDRTKGESWNYPLPRGVIQQPIELVVPGRVKADGPGQWLLPGADGSVHILAADGTLVDTFNSGETLTGLATVLIDGTPTLLISSTTGLVAWSVK